MDTCEMCYGPADTWYLVDGNAEFQLCPACVQIVRTELDCTPLDAEPALGPRGMLIVP